MSNTTSPVSCDCGKLFKDFQAMMQHTRDSPRHAQQTTPLPTTNPAAPSWRGKVKCQCGRIFKSEEALQQHQGDSSLHPETNAAIRSSGLKYSCGKIIKDKNGLEGHMRTSLRYHKLEELCARPANDDGKNLFGSPNDGDIIYYPYPRDDDWPPPGGAVGLRNIPVAFVREGQDTANLGGKRRSKRGKKRQSYGVWSSSGDYYSDVGDNHSLCDKDCGWCGHCADHVDF